MKIIFMSTSEFGCPLLSNLIRSNHEIVAIYTKAHSKSGRGMKIKSSPIYELASLHNLNIITPTNFNCGSEVEKIRALNADLIIVVSYGLILPEEIIKSCKYYAINIHPSKLPKYRGAAPMQRTLFNNDTVSAMTIIKMDKNLDSGDIILQEDVAVNYNDNYTTLSHKMSDLAIQLTNQLINNINNISFTKQDHKLATYANKISKSECKIDFSKSSNEIYNKIRGLHNNLGAFMLYNDIIIKIHQAEIIKDNSNVQAGTILDSNFTIKCLDNAIRPIILQKSGRKIMKLNEFLMGFTPEINKIL